MPNIDLLKYIPDEKKKDSMSYNLNIKEDDLKQFKKDLKNFVKKHSEKKNTRGTDEYKVQLMPLGDDSNDNEV